MIKVLQVDGWVDGWQVGRIHVRVRVWVGEYRRGEELSAGASEFTTEWVGADDEIHSQQS